MKERFFAFWSSKLLEPSNTLPLLTYKYMADLQRKFQKKRPLKRDLLAYQKKLIAPNRRFYSYYLPAGGYNRNLSHFDCTFRQVGVPVLAGSTIRRISGLYPTIPDLRKHYEYSRQIGRMQLIQRLLAYGRGTISLLGSLAFICSLCTILHDDSGENSADGSTKTADVMQPSSSQRNESI